MRSPKFSAPALQAHLVSTQALQHMGNIETYSAHWLSAGPGAGKTQTARLWLENLKRPYSWVQLDPRDNDPLAFLEALRLALQPLLAPSSLLPSFMPQGGLSLQRHCEHFWYQVVATLRQPSVLVLDDAHLIEDWGAHPVLHRLLLELDTRLHVVVLSRGGLPLAYVRHVVNRRIRWVQPHHFVWDNSHVRAWLISRWKIKKPTLALVEQLLKISQGKAGVLALLDIPTLLESPEPMARAAASQLDLSRLMESSFLEKLSSEEQEVLRWLACLGSFPQEWLNRLGFPLAVQRYVDQWMQSTTVVMKLERNEGELRLHPLFAELLRKGQRSTHGELAQLRTRVIDACIARGRIPDAIELCRATGLWERYWAIVQSAGFDWIEQGQLGLLERSLYSIPKATQAQFAGPTLSLFLAALALHERPEQAYALATEALQGSSRDPQLRTVWATALSMTANAVLAAGLSLEHFTPIIEELETAIHASWFDELSAPLRLSALRAGLLTAMLGQGRPPIQLIGEKTHQALAQCESMDLHAATVSAMMRVMVLHGLSEYVESAQAQLKYLEDLVVSPAGTLSLLHAHSTLFLALGQKTASLRASNELLAKCDRGAASIWHIEVRAAAAFCAACTHDFPQLRTHCEALVQQTQQMQHVGPGPRLQAQFYLGIVAAHDQQWTAAKRHFEQALLASNEFQYPLTQVAALSALSIVNLELGDIQGGRDNLQEIEALLSRSPIPLYDRFFVSTLAFFEIRTQSTQDAIPAVRTAVREITSSNFYFFIVEALPQYAEFLAFALEHDIETERVNKLIRRSPLYPKTRPHPRWPCLFELQVLGRFELKINGKGARERFLSSGRRFELLTVLFWVGGRGLSHHECLAWIWDHMEDRTRGLRTMKTAIKRLRSDLEREDAILDEDGRLSLNPELWSYDAWGIHERLSEQGQTPDPSTLTLLRRGFFGPTPIPAAMRHLVPSQGAVDLGPKPLLEYLRRPKPAESDDPKSS